MTFKYCLIALIFLPFTLCQSKKADTSDDAKQDDDWIYLFGGADTDQWRGAGMDHFPESGWYISDGELLNDGSSSGDLISKDQYTNFILEWEWRLFDVGGNSGLKYFVKEDFGEEGDRVLGLEYQMLDDERHEWMLAGKMKPNDYHTTAALYEFFEPAETKKLKPLGEFNHSKIISNGKHVEHWLNGVKVLEYERGGEDFLKMKKLSKFKNYPDFGLHEQGHLMLQDHQSKVGFRNIRIKLLEV